MNHISIKTPDYSDFNSIKNYVSQFDLDSRALNPAYFLAAKNINNEVVGFGRIRHHKTCDELCSLGVVESERYKGIGKSLSLNLINAAIHPLYLVCIIPTFFKSLGFKIVSEYPEELKEKLNFCTSELVVPEEYVVMRYYG